MSLRHRDSGWRIAASNTMDLAFPRQVHDSQEARHQGKEIRNSIRLDAKDQNRDAPARKILLVFQSLIHGHEDLDGRRSPRD